MAQKSSTRSATGNLAAWPNDIGYFEHQPTNNNVAMSASIPGKVLIVGSTAIVGRGSGSSNGLSGFGNDSIAKVDFAKIDLSRRSTELAFRNSNSPVLQMRKVLVDNTTQTDNSSNGNVCYFKFF